MSAKRFTGASFAAWFRREAASLTCMTPTAALELIYDQLIRVHPHLAVEVSRDATWELIVSANGDRELFDEVRSIVRAIGELPDWTICALKPPRGFAFTNTTDGHSLKARDLYFEPTRSAAYPAGIGVRILAADSPITEERAWWIIESAIGEEAAAMLDSVTVGVLPVPHDHLLPLEQLPDYVHWRVTKRARESS